MISELRKNSGATFDLYDLTDRERIVEVGGLYQFKLTGVELLLKSLETCAGRSGSVTILVPADRIGQIIGKSGVVVQDVSKTSGAKVEIDKTPFSIQSADPSNPNNNTEGADDYRKVLITTQPHAKLFYQVTLFISPRSRYGATTTRCASRVR